MSAGVLSGEVALISGALGDIGRAIALQLARDGAAVALGDVLSPDKALPFLSELHALSRDGEKQKNTSRKRNPPVPPSPRLPVGSSPVTQAGYDRVDVTSHAAVNKWIANTQLALGTPTLIIVNAAIVEVASLRETTPEVWDRHLRVNLDGAFFMAQAAALNLVKQKKPGRIVFIGSWAGHVPHTHIPAYSVAKAGLRMLCQLLAAEFAADGILANEVAPGYVDAGLSGKLFDKNPGSREKARAKVPIKKLISAADVALEVAHLCDPRNQHMTGSVIVMDGGLSLLRGPG